MKNMIPVPKSEPSSEESEVEEDIKPAVQPTYEEIEVEEDGNQNLRPLRCEMGVLSRPDGSALLTTGNTAVVAAMYGPVEVKLQKIMIDKAYVEAIYRPKMGLPTVADRMREALLRNTCEVALLAAMYPRTSVSIVLQEMQDSGGLLACAVNAAFLALMNSGIAMKFQVAAVTCMIDKQDSIVLDPTDKQLQDSKASLTFVFDSISHGIVASHTAGSFTQMQYQESLLACREGSKKVFAFYRDVAKKYVSRV